MAQPGAPPAAWQGPEIQKNQTTDNSEKRLTHRISDAPGNREAAICLVAAHGNAFELFELAKEVLDQMTPLVHVLIDLQRLAPARTTAFMGALKTFLNRLYSWKLFDINQ
jgi:hypothetical protein